MSTYLSFNQVLYPLFHLLDIRREPLANITDHSINQQLQSQSLSALHDPNDSRFEDRYSINRHLFVCFLALFSREVLLDLIDPELDSVRVEGLVPEEGVGGGDFFSGRFLDKDSSSFSTHREGLEYSYEFLLFYVYQLGSAEWDLELTNTSPSL